MYRKILVTIIYGVLGNEYQYLNELTQFFISFMIGNILGMEYRKPLEHLDFIFI